VPPAQETCERGPTVCQRVGATWTKRQMRVPLAAMRARYSIAQADLAARQMAVARREMHRAALGELKRVQFKCRRGG
jgi:hypothetical protein